MFVAAFMEAILNTCNYTPRMQRIGRYTVFRLSVHNIFVSTQYLGKTLMDFDQILHMH